MVWLLFLRDMMIYYMQAKDEYYSPNDIYKYLKSKENKNYSISIGNRKDKNIIRCYSKKQTRCVTYIDYYDKQKKICIPHSKKYLSFQLDQNSIQLETDFSDFFKRIISKDQTVIQKEEPVYIAA